GCVVQYIVVQLGVTIGFDANLLKLLSGAVVAILLAGPYWKGKYFTKPAAKKAQKDSGSAALPQAQAASAGTAAALNGPARSLDQKDLSRAEAEKEEQPHA